MGMVGEVIGHRPEEFQASYRGMMVLSSVLLFIAGRQLEETDARQIGVVNVKGVEVARVLADEPGGAGHVGFFRINVILEGFRDIFAREFINDQFHVWRVFQGQGDLVLDVARQVGAVVVILSFLFVLQNIVGDLINEINARLGDGRFQDAGTERLVDVVADPVVIHFLDPSFFLSTPAPLQIFFLLHLQ